MGALWSFVLHGCWFNLSYKAACRLEPQNLPRRGWTMLMTQGTMNSFLYPLLLRHTRFGERALATAVLWDLGGNMWICQLALFAIAAKHSPLQHSGLLAKSDGEKEGALKNGGMMPGLVAFIDGIMPHKVLVDALRQPVLIACILGFVLNCIHAQQPNIVDATLCVLGEPYRLVLYFLVGFYGDHKLGAREIVSLLRTLSARYTIAVIMIVIVVTALPVELMQRQTIALVVLSPTSSYLIHLVAEHGYGDALMQLTVCGAFATTVVSTFVQHMLVAIFEKY